MPSSPSLHCQTCGTVLDVTRSEGVCAVCLFDDAQGQEVAKVFGGHELGGEIARGGMGVVYRAVQREPRREVALKTLRGIAMDSPDVLARFQNEAAAMAGLDHPAILPVYYFGESDGVPFFTMKLAHGGSLAERLADYSGKWRAIAELVVTVADAVQHAHQRAVLHRDLKPGNILFDEDGKVYVSDFGIAKLAEVTDGALTVTHALLGTPFYISPEVAHDPRSATTASDVWGLGVILYEMLTQRRPFEEPSLSALLNAIAEKEPVPPARLHPDVPRDLAVIAMKALSKDPSRRYASARKMAEDLRCWLEGRPIVARPVALAERLYLWSKRRPELAILSALVLVLSLAAVASLAWGVKRANEAAQKASASRDDSQQRLRDALIERSRSARLAHRSGWRERGIKALREAAGIHDGLDVRNEAIAHLVAMDLEEGEVIPVPGDAVPSASFDQFGSVVEATPGHCEVRFFDATGKPAGAAVSVDFSPVAGSADDEPCELVFDSLGQRLAVQKKGAGVALIDVGARRVVSQWPGASFGGFSADGALFVLMVTRDVATVFHSADGSQAGEVKGSSTRQLGWNLVKLQPVGESAMILLTMDKNLEFWRWHDPRRVALRLADEVPARIEWTGDWVASAGKEMSQVTLWNLRTGRVRSLPTDDSAPASLTFSADGRWLAAASLRGTSASVWDTVSGQRVLKSTEVFPRHFSSDATRFTQHTNGRLTLGTVRRSAALKSLDVSAVSQGLAFMDISPDGRWVLLNSRELSESRAIAGCLSIWEIASGRLVCHNNRFSHSVPAAFLADSAHIVGQRVFPHGSTAATFCVHTLTQTDGVLSVDEREEIMPVDLNGMPGLELSPDRRWVAVGGEADALLFDFADPNAAPAGKPMSRTVLDAFVNGGAWSGQGKAAQLLDADEKKPAQPWPPPVVSPDGHWSARVEGDQLRVLAAGTQQVAHEHTIAFRPGYRLPLAWSPDSRWLAFVSQRHDVTLVDAATGETIAELSGPLDDPIVALRFTPDGRTVVLLRDAGVLEFWNLSTLAAELSALGMPWELPPPVQPAAPGITGPVNKARLMKLYGG